eukprot:13516636-Alexandrium_andersonii.AAC.1
MQFQADFGSFDGHNLSTQLFRPPEACPRHLQADLDSAVFLKAVPGSFGQWQERLKMPKSSRP